MVITTTYNSSHLLEVEPSAQQMMALETTLLHSNLSPQKERKTHSKSIWNKAWKSSLLFQQKIGISITLYISKLSYLFCADIRRCHRSVLVGKLQIFDEHNELLRKKSKMERCSQQLSRKNSSVMSAVAEIQIKSFQTPTFHQEKKS